MNVHARAFTPNMNWNVQANGKNAISTNVWFSSFCFFSDLFFKAEISRNGHFGTTAFSVCLPVGSCDMFCSLLIYGFSNEFVDKFVFTKWIRSDLISVSLKKNAFGDSISTPDHSRKYIIFIYFIFRSGPLGAGALQRVLNIALSTYIVSSTFDYNQQ